MGIAIAIALMMVVGLPVAAAIWYWSNPSHTFLWSKGRRSDPDNRAAYLEGVAEGYRERYGQQYYPPGGEPPGYGQPPSGQPPSGQGYGQAPYGQGQAPYGQGYGQP